MTVKITNLILDGDRFKVWFEFGNGLTELHTFMPTDTAVEIRAKRDERKLYFEELELKEQALRDELLNIEI
jgi:hypothetical protein